MPEMAPLTSITIRAFRMAWQQHFVWWIAIFIGALMGISSYVAGGLQPLFTDSGTDRSLLLHSLTRPSTIGLIGLSLLAASIQSALRGSLILILNRRKDKENSASQRKIAWGEYRHAAVVTLICEITYVFILSVIAILIAIPCFAAWRFNPSILSGILEIGIILFLLISIYLYCIKELTLLYTLLGNIQLPPALDLSARLYRRQTLNTTLFFFYAALLALGFVLFIESCISISGISELRTTFSFSLVLGLPLGLYSVFDQALRVSFFYSIATPPKKPVETKTILEPRESQSGVVPS